VGFVLVNFIAGIRGVVTRVGIDYNLEVVNGIVNITLVCVFEPFLRLR